MAKKKEILTDYTLKPWTGDKLHIDSDIQRVDGCKKTWNFIVTERESGKSTLLWKKVYNVFKRSSRPSIIVRRYQADITSLFLEGISTIVSTFTDQNVTFDYSKSDMTSGGMLDLYMCIDDKRIDKVFCRIIALNTTLSRLKSQVLENPKYIFYDEFICNKRIGEKYLDDEPFRLKEGVYNTYKRYVEDRADGTKDLSIYFFGNPYSVFNPFFSDLKINTNKIYPGAFVVENDYCVYCYQIKQELREKLLAENPLYKFDDAYKKYAFDGRAIQDADIRIETEQPLSFKLAYVFKIHGKCLGIYRGYQEESPTTERLYYWTKLIDASSISKRRDIICFDFGDMASRTVLLDNNGKKLYTYLRQAIEHRWIAYASVEESWLMEEIHQEL